MGCCRSGVKGKACCLGMYGGADGLRDTRIKLGVICKENREGCTGMIVMEMVISSIY